MEPLKDFSRNSQWQDAVGLLAQMSSRRVAADEFFFNKLVSTCAACQAWQSCMQLLSDMIHVRIPPDVRACNTALGAVAKTPGCWDKALHFLASMRTRDSDPDTVTCNAAIAACTGSSEWSQALQLLHESKQLPSGPDEITYGATISACQGKWELVLCLLDEMPAVKLRPNEVISAAAIGACSRGSNPESGIQLFRSLKQRAVRQNAQSYTAAMSACHKDQYLWEWSLWLLTDMKDEKVELDIGVLNAAMGVCRNAHGFGRLQRRDSELVEKLMSDVRFLRLNPDLVTYSHVMAAAREAGDWERVLELLDKALSSQQPDSMLFTNAIAALADASGWDKALFLLERARPYGLSEVHYSSAMTACADATHWEHALRLYVRMAEDGLTSGAGGVLDTAVMCSLMRGGHWEQCLATFERMLSRGEEPNYVTLTSVIKACATTTDWVFAMHWKNMMDKLGVEPYFTTYACLIDICAEAEQWSWVEYLLAECVKRFPNSENFDQRQFYNLVLLKCLKSGSCHQAMGFWKDCRQAGVSSCNALLATCEVAMDWDDWVEACGTLGPTHWAQDVGNIARRAVGALARAKVKGHGTGWQQDAIGQVALTLDLLSWHGLAAAAKPLELQFSADVLDYVVQAIIAETDKTVLFLASTGRTSTRTSEAILKGAQLQNVMLSEALTQNALIKLDMAKPSHWVAQAQLMTRRALPTELEGRASLSDPVLRFQARWISYKPTSGPEGQGQNSKGFVVLGSDDGCRNWLAPFSLENSLGLPKTKHTQLLRELMQVAGLRNGKVRLYLSYTPSLACLASLHQLQSHEGIDLQMAFDTWRETRLWTGERIAMSGPE